MSTYESVPATKSPVATFSGRTSSYLLRLLALAFIDAVAIWLISRMFVDGVWQLATVLLTITLFINVVFLREEFYPLRWMSPGLALMILMIVYPLIFTVYIAFTNYSTGHLLTKEQVVSVLGQNRFVGEGGLRYEWVAFRSTATGEYLLALIPPEGEVLLARPGEPVFPAVSGEEGVGALDERGVPTAIEGYQRLERRDTVRILRDLGNLEFGAAPDTIKISTLSVATQSQQRYVFDPDQDIITDQQSGTVYRADPSQGNFVSDEGQVLTPGYRVPIGWNNFERIVNNPALRGPFVQVFIWTFVFAIGSVFLTFALGLALALVFNDPRGFRAIHIEYYQKEPNRTQQGVISKFIH